MKKSKIPKTNNLIKILRYISRNEQIERNGGGQFVSMNRKYKDKKKYNRNDKKKELRKDLNSYFLHYFPFCFRNSTNSHIVKSLI